MKIKIDFQKCTGCGRCEEVCPKKVFVIDAVTKKADPVRKDWCIQCFMCASTCPHDAIKIMLKEKNDQ